MVASPAAAGNSPVAAGTSAQVDDRGDRAAAVGALVGGGDRHEDGGVAGDGRGDAADRGLDLAVPVHVGVVEHRVAAAADLTVLGRLALEEDVDQAAVEVGGAGALGKVEAGRPDGLPDAVLVEGVLHDRVADPVAAADAGGI